MRRTAWKKQAPTLSAAVAARHQVGILVEVHFGRTYGQHLAGEWRRVEICDALMGSIAEFRARRGIQRQVIHLPARSEPYDFRVMCPPEPVPRARLRLGEGDLLLLRVQARKLWVNLVLTEGCMTVEHFSAAQARWIAPTLIEHSRVQRPG